MNSSDDSSWLARGQSRLRALSESRNSLSISSVDGIAACSVEGVEQLEATLLVHAAHAKRFPLVADAHSAELDGRDMDTCTGREGPVDTELGGGCRRRCPSRHCVQEMFEYCGVYETKRF